jgi:beta-lactamase superfamily II metal-dependent hydrolase
VAEKKRRLKRLLIVLPFVIVFILFANICDKGILPAWLQKPINAANNATGGIIYNAPVNKSGISVHIIDVGQGDSILICCQGSDMLIDGGIPAQGPNVESYLKSEGVTKLDYVVGTHPDDDHIGGLVSVIKDFNVSTIMMSNVHDTTETYKNLLDVIAAKNKKITVVKPGDTYSLGGAQFTILGPVGNYEDLNNMSVVIRLYYKQRSFLFTGDASKESEDDMLKENCNLSADVLKVGHHGSSTATTPEFLKAVHPKYAVISVGAGNSYGLPDSSVINELKAAGVVTLRTDINGTVVFYSDGYNITYKKEKNGGYINESS